MKIYIFIFLLVFNTPAYAQSLAEKWRESVNGAIVYIDIQVTDAENGGIDRQIGTGFIISEDGHLLTAHHIFNDWNKQTPSQKKKNIISGRVGGKTSNDKYPLDFVGDPETRADVVLLKLMNPSKPFPSLPLCFSNVPEGSEALAYGFPLDQDLQPTPVTLGRRNALGGRYAADSNFTYGMSGGPVLNQDGVIGIVKGSETYRVKVDGGDGSVIMDSAAVRLITPIQHAKNLADRVQGVQECNSIPVAREEPASSSDLREIRRRESRILSLKKEVISLLVDHKSININTDNSKLIYKIRMQAPSVARELKLVSDKDIRIGHKIIKYEYAAMAFMLAASHENSVPELSRYIEKGIVAGRRALLVIDEVLSRDRESNHLDGIEDWIRKDNEVDRVKYILAILYAIKSQKISDNTLFSEIEKLLGDISDYYREMYPFEDDPYLRWYLTEKAKQ
ncbi:MAG: serine protease [Desulfobulbaceae bacterium]|nr:serine protease [Desulfobulbaceae bacterium]